MQTRPCRDEASSPILLFVHLLPLLTSLLEKRLAFVCSFQLFACLLHSAQGPVPFSSSRLFNMSSDHSSCSQYRLPGGAMALLCGHADLNIIHWLGAGLEI